jgi:hypothetical protein
MNDARTVKDVHPTARQHPNEQVAADTEKRSGGDDLACLARSLRAEKASSVAFESRLAWLTRILLPPEPLNGPYNQPPPTLQPPRKPNPAKWIKRAHEPRLRDQERGLRRKSWNQDLPGIVSTQLDSLPWGAPDYRCSINPTLSGYKMREWIAEDSRRPCIVVVGAPRGDGAQRLQTSSVQSAV